jgi:hypothetical protein
MRAAILIGLAAILLASGCSASACIGSGCGAGKLDTPKAERTIRTLVAAQTGAMVSRVACPHDVAEKRGATFTCTATGADGTTAPVLVTQTDGKGNVHISAPTLLHTGTAAHEIAAHLTAQVKTTVTVRCPDLLEAHAGTTLTCKATDAAGDVRSVAVTVTDAQGGIRYRLQ